MRVKPASVDRGAGNLVSVKLFTDIQLIKNPDLTRGKGLTTKLDNIQPGLTEHP